MAKIEQWGVVPLHVDPYQPPECIPHGVHGLVYGHKSVKDGDEIITSRIVKVAYDAATDSLGIVTASGSQYELGQVGDLYERQFPNARERFIKGNT